MSTRSALLRLLLISVASLGIAAFAQAAPRVPAEASACATCVGCWTCQDYTKGWSACSFLSGCCGTEGKSCSVE